MISRRSRLLMAARDPRSGASKGLQGITPTNSNTKISASRLPTKVNTSVVTGAPSNLGLNSERLREAMIKRLRVQGISNEYVLAAMQKVPRHVFVDEALASRAYDDAALPIGYGQTISQPWVVARMIAAVCEQTSPKRVLEVGTGCGYQAAVMAQLFPQVYSIERIRALYDIAKEKLRDLKLTKIRLTHADGMDGWTASAPFDAIIVAAAGVRIPNALLLQLAESGVLIAPEGGTSQKLVKITRTGQDSFERIELEEVRFVPLRSGVQS